jgi:hypothetical protein
MRCVHEKKKSDSLQHNKRVAPVCVWVPPSSISPSRTCGDLCNSSRCVQLVFVFPPDSHFPNTTIINSRQTVRICIHDWRSPTTRLSEQCCQLCVFSLAAESGRFGKHRIWPLNSAKNFYRRFEAETSVTNGRVSVISWLKRRLHPKMERQPNYSSNICEVSILIGSDYQMANFFSARSHTWSSQKIHYIEIYLTHTMAHTFSTCLRKSVKSAMISVCRWKIYPSQPTSVSFAHICGRYVTDNNRDTILLFVHSRKHVGSFYLIIFWFSVFFCFFR